MKNRLSIIDALEAARSARKMTQAELASRSGTSRVTVGRIEAGFDPKLSTVYEMARALGLELTLVPKSLAGEVQAFLRSGGRSLAQPVGASAPPSVVDLAAVATALQASPPAATRPSREAKTNRSKLPTKSFNQARASGRPMISESAAKKLGLSLQNRDDIVELG
jgi:transcriptional regulator with XRE-family HTH domain